MGKCFSKKSSRASDGPTRLVIEGVNHVRQTVHGVDIFVPQRSAKKLKTQLTAFHEKKEAATEAASEEANCLKHLLEAKHEELRIKDKKMKILMEEMQLKDQVLQRKDNEELKQKREADLFSNLFGPESKDVAPQSDQERVLELEIQHLKLMISRREDHTKRLSDFQFGTSKKPILEKSGKRMSDFFHYTESQHKLIEYATGIDFTNYIRDEHEEDAEFVTDHVVTYRNDKNARYTGWMRQEKMEGRGTLFFEFLGQRRRYDGMWKKHRMHGKGRCMEEERGLVRQGEFDDDNWANGAMEYSMTGSVRKYYSKVDGWE